MSFRCTAGGTTFVETLSMSHTTTRPRPTDQDLNLQNWTQTHGTWTHKTRPVELDQQNCTLRTKPENQSSTTGLMKLDQWYQTRWLGCTGLVVLVHLNLSGFADPVVPVQLDSSSCSDMFALVWQHWCSGCAGLVVPL